MFLHCLILPPKARANAQFCLTLWKRPKLPSFINLDVAGNLPSVFHQWCRPAPPIHMITTLQIGKLFSASVHTFPGLGSCPMLADLVEIANATFLYNG